MNKKIIEISAFCFVTAVAVFMVMYYFFISPPSAKNPTQQVEKIADSKMASSTANIATTTPETAPETTATQTAKIATSTPRLSMTDYLRAIPEKYLPAFMQGKTGAKRDAYIGIEDEANYYLRISPESAGVHMGGGLSFGEIALFLGKENHDVLAVNNKTCIPIGCINDDLFFLTFENGVWSNVTKKLLPATDEAYIERETIETILKETKTTDFDEDPSNLPNVVYRLPRLGTGIILEEEKTGTKLYEFTWNGKQFSAKKLRSTPQIALTGQNIIGLWQANRGGNSMGQSYTDRYHFFADGRYSYVPNETADCSKEVIQMDGNYRLQNGKLYLRPRLVLSLYPGLTIEDAQCPGGKKLDPDEINMQELDDDWPEEVLPITTFSIAEYIKLKDTGFWKLTDDPSEDAPAPIGSNVKADDYQ